MYKIGKFEYLITYSSVFASMANNSSCDKVSGRTGSCSIARMLVCFFLCGTIVNLGSDCLTCILLHMMAPPAGGVLGEDLDVNLCFL